MSNVTSAQDQAQELLEEKIASALRHNPHVQLRNLRFEAGDGRVTLHGKVGSWYQKQMAQESLIRIDGVDRVENQLEVCWS